MTFDLDDALVTGQNLLNLYLTNQAKVKSSQQSTRPINTSPIMAQPALPQWGWLLAIGVGAVFLLILFRPR